ncbi:MAG: hypothetical protein C4332_12005 [Meiothermus sp.]
MPEKVDQTKMDKQIVSVLLETKAINFEALGRAIAQVGPSSIAIYDDGWERWCGSDLRIYRWPRPFGLEDILKLQELVNKLPGRAG